MQLLSSCCISQLHYEKSFANSHEAILHQCLLQEEGSRESFQRYSTVPLECNEFSSQLVLKLNSQLDSQVSSSIRNLIERSAACLHTCNLIRNSICNVCSSICSSVCSSIQSSVCSSIHSLIFSSICSLFAAHAEQPLQVLLRLVCPWGG